MSNARELSELAGSYGTGGFVGMKNRIINGGMMIDQRNAGASVTPTDGSFTLDRWKTSVTQASKLSMQRVSTAPAGFVNSILVTSLAATTVGTNDTFGFYQPIEGYNVADLGFGAAGAATISISFWVRSSITGTYSISVTNGAVNRSCPVAYTINAANTWEQKTITIAGDTSGTWTTDNTSGLQLFWNLGVGSNFGGGTSGVWTVTKTGAVGQTNWISTSGATFYITGVQLEKGSTATSFDYRPYGAELQLCQRYYQQLSSSTSSGSYMPYGTGLIASTTYGFVQIPTLVSFRSTPTLTNATVSQFRFGFTTCTALAVNSPSTNTVSLRCDVASGLTSGQAAQLDSNNNQTSYIGLSAEL